MVNGVIRLVDKHKLKIELHIQYLMYPRQHWGFDLFSVVSSNPFFSKERTWEMFQITMFGIGFRYERYF